MWLYHVYPSVSGHLGGFFLVVVNNVAVNICVCVFVWTRVFFPRGCVAEGGVAGSRGGWGAPERSC